MATNLETKIGRIRNNVTSALAKIAEKGVTVPEGAGSDDLEGLIDAITGGGGGLPDGISEINTGSFILSSAPGSYYRIKHGLSRRPNLWVLYAECEDIATLPDCTLYAACGFYMAHSKDDYGGVFYLGVHYDEIYGSDYSFSNDGVTSDTQISIPKYSNEALGVGVNYRWIAAVVDGMK